MKDEIGTGIRFFTEAANRLSLADGYPLQGQRRRLGHWRRRSESNAQRIAPYDLANRCHTIRRRLRLEG